MAWKVKGVVVSDYSATGVKQVTPLAGIRKAASSGTAVRFAQGCRVNTNSRRGFRRALRIARGSDAVILCMGNVSGLPDAGGVTEGEANDRCCLDLSGVQEELIQAVCKVKSRPWSAARRKTSG